MLFQLFLMTSAAQLKMFVLASDREYFARPVRVELDHSDVRDRTLFVRDMGRGGVVFPVNPRQLVPGYRLSKRQRKLANAGNVVTRSERS